MESRMPLIGDRFPEMQVQTTHGVMNLPKDLAGKWFILFSHPADFTPVCTTEFVAFQNRYKEFKDLNCELIGLSIDQVFSHIKWVEWIKDKLNVEIQFPIIADTGAVAEKLGLIHPSKGKNTVRAVFFVDPNSIIRAIVYYPQELGRNFDEFLRMLKGLQISDEQKVAIPANWPNNEIIGNKVIIPPPTDITAARYKKEKYQNFDWWFLYRELEAKES
ncbi:MAG: peroxiredoxin [Ignavibacteria bacterium]|nr:peroxiredoxin [Ignavibacteria bacterium]